MTTRDLCRRIRKARSAWWIPFLGVISGLLGTTPDRGDHDQAAARTWSLEECLSAAMAKNHRRAASKFAVAVAEAQHRQALAAYWPRVDLRGTLQRLDEAPSFLFPSRNFEIPGGDVAVTLPPGALGPGSPEIPLQVNFPGQTFTLAEQHIKVADPRTEVTSLSGVWLLYDGGMRKGLRQRARAGIQAALEVSRRTDLEITDSVKRLYYGAVLARQIHRVGQDTLERMNATLRLTEALYKEGAGTVKKTDYLGTKVVVETLRATLALLEKNEKLAEMALANTMGLSWKESVRPSAKTIPFEPFATNLSDLVGTAYQFSPDWRRLEAGIQADRGALRSARSGYRPKIVLTGELHRLFNNFNAGLVTDRNKKGWAVGVGITIPLFDGFLTRHRVAEMRARLDQRQEQRLLLREGIGLQVRDVFLGLEAAQKRYQATREALKSARENRDLNIRAYQNELVETEDVIRAQLVEAFMSAQHDKMRYDHIALQSRLNLVVGAEVLRRIERPEKAP